VRRERLECRLEPDDFRGRHSRAGPPVVLWYVIRWLGRGLNHRPGIAWAAILFLVAVLVLAALSFQHFFPNCYVWGYMGHCRQMPLASKV
jgi:hypothetical protein